MLSFYLSTGKKAILSYRGNQPDFLFLFFLNNFLLDSTGCMLGFCLRFFLKKQKNSCSKKKKKNPRFFKNKLTFIFLPQI